MTPSKECTKLVLWQRMQMDTQVSVGSFPCKSNYLITIASIVYRWPWSNHKINARYDLSKYVNEPQQPWKTTSFSSLCYLKH